MIIKLFTYSNELAKKNRDPVEILKFFLLLIIGVVVFIYSTYFGVILLGFAFSYGGKIFKPNQEFSSYAIDENGIRSIEECLKEKHKELKYLLTNRPIAKNDKSVVVAKNIVQYSLDRKIEITNIINSIKSEYFNLKILLKS